MKNKVEWCSMAWNPYIAGFFDGEGSAVILTTKRLNLRRPFRFRPIISITQKNRFVLDKIKDYLKMGKVINDNHKMHRYVICNCKHISKFISMIEQYSLIKQKQLNLLLQYIDVAILKGNRSYNKEELNKVITMRNKLHFLNQTTRNLKYDRKIILEANL